MTRTVVAALLAVAVLGALSVALLLLPGLVVDHDLAGARLAAADRMGAVNNVRSTLLQAIGGAVVLFGAYATWTPRPPSPVSGSWARPAAPAG